MSRISFSFGQDFPADGEWYWAICPGAALFVSALPSGQDPDNVTLYFDTEYDVDPYAITPEESTTLTFEATRIEASITSSPPTDLAEYFPRQGTVAVIDGPTGPLWVRLRLHHNAVVQQEYTVANGEVVASRSVDIKPNPLAQFVDPQLPTP
ncbi:hypothetical protein SEA_VANLEE_27 [Gordonia phage VanLee]|uniref:Uncharacterized protein n=1 Tax=Gordonia phage VanLee TaxID=2845816 RepID=A0A8F2D9C6_9CAUD|nr:hypothetical protein QEH49_gp027 [Gordonia phage VanLee]QWS68145.1 hypothetical protein SEA_VANLEE_27 [Gordonia phage VanLee]